MLASLLSALPTWTSFDPLPILTAAEIDQDGLLYEGGDEKDAKKQQEQQDIEGKKRPQA